jgi:hypothetical protein
MEFLVHLLMELSVWPRVCRHQQPDQQKQQQQSQKNPQQNAQGQSGAAAAKQGVRPPFRRPEEVVGRLTLLQAVGLLCLPVIAFTTPQSSTLHVVLFTQHESGACSGRQRKASLL